MWIGQLAWSAMDYSRDWLRSWPSHWSLVLEVVHVVVDKLLLLGELLLLGLKSGMLTKRLTRERRMVVAGNHGWATKLARMEAMVLVRTVGSSSSLR